MLKVAPASRARSTRALVPDSGRLRSSPFSGPLLPSPLEIHDEISSDTAESMGEDLSAAMGSAVEAYTSLPPIITVAPGAAITVMVDRDWKSGDG